MFSKSSIATPIGEMTAIANEIGITYLFFTDTAKYEFESEIISDDENEILRLLKIELTQYFEGKRKDFTVPIDFIGSDFQIEIWKEIQKIPFGKTFTYAQLCKDRPKAIRAVANANARNKILILVPCHRVIGSNGSLTGYSGGLDRKAFLLKLENAEPIQNTAQLKIF